VPGVRSRDPDRTRAVQLATEARATDRPLDWFEQLYSEARDPEDVPWAELAPNQWLVRQSEVQAGSGRALVVGCGYGDDAAWLTARGWTVTAFDIAPSAVRTAQDRFGGSGIEFVTADLLDLPDHWQSAYDLVVEIFTLQVLPQAGLRERAFAALTGVLRPGGLLFVHCRLRHPDDPPGDFPWPLTPGEVRAGLAGLTIEQFDDFIDDTGDQPVRRLRALARKP
jgi:SAM-dependent methyltransferase